MVTILVEVVGMAGEKRRMGGDVVTSGGRGEYYDGTDQYRETPEL